MNNVDIGKKEELTIVVPVWNREHLVTRCLDSVKAQTYRPLRLIVVDNNSTDGTADAVREWAEANGADGFEVELLSETRQGAAAARKCGENMVWTRVVAFFDSDDTMRPDYAESIMNEYSSSPELDIVSWRVLFHKLDGSEAVSNYWNGSGCEKHLVNAVLKTQGYAVRTDFLRAAGGWDPDMREWDDWELGVRLLMKDPKVRFLDKVLADVWCQEVSITGTSFSGRIGVWEDVMDLVEKYIRDSGRPDMNRWLRIVDYRRVILAADYYKEGAKKEANALFRMTMNNPELSLLNKIGLWFSYRYTRRRLRGAFLIVSPLIH